jgi:RimJ/RimL family protein N-acetyltransferase
MHRAEDIARAHGCIGLWLDTYEFQARGFYEKLGFTLFGTLDDHPVGRKRFFLQKRIDRPVPDARPDTPTEDPPPHSMTG